MLPKLNICALKVVLFSVFVSVSFVVPSAAEPLKFLTHSVGEQGSFDDAGYLRGKPHAGRRAFNIEIVREMMLSMGQDPVFEIVPFKRGLQIVQNDDNLALFNVNRTSSREETLKWVGPLQSSVTHFYENRHAVTGVKSLEDAKSVRSICVLRGNVHHRYLEKNGFKNLSPVNSYENCVAMLRMERVSLTPLSNISTLLRDDASKETGFLLKTPVLLMESKGYLAFSKSMPDDVVKQWQLAFDALVNSGRYDELLTEYLLPPLE